MKTISFPDWETRLESSEIPYGEKKSFAITIRWYLSYCQQQQHFVDFSSARSFINKAIQSKPQTSEWVIERWKEGIRWLFRNAPKTTQKVKEPNETKVKAMRLGQSVPEWRLRMLTTLRKRQMSYRTETTYIGWVLRFARFVGHHDLERLKTDSINHFMDHLVRDLRVSAGTQRQALNALVFLYREVFQKNLGEFAEYKKAYSKNGFQSSYHNLNFKAFLIP